MAKKKTEDQKSTDELRQRLIEVTALSQRVLADYQNLEKRVARDQRQFVKVATMGIVHKLLPVMDHLQRAVTHMKDPGLTMIAEQMMAVLTEEGVAVIETAGKEFDPLTMECVDRVGGKKDRVVEVTEPGYTMNDQVIRPAKVKVGTG
jgi:molecular chaperone GrpE